MVRTRLRRVAVALLSATGLLAIVIYARHAAPLITDADLAFVELYTELATRGTLLVGPYSRFGWHHPGPLFFYVLAPFYALSGHRAPALYATALALNLVAIVTLAWVAGRDVRRWPLAVLLAGACVLLAWRVPMFMASPWTAHVPVLPCLTFLVLSAAVAGGRLTLLPLMAAFASFVAQTHVGFVPLVGVITVGVLACGALDRAGDRRLFRRAIVQSALVCAALWLVPIGEALSGQGGNAVALGRFFVTEAGPGHSFREAFSTWSYGLTSVLRPDFILPWGSHFALTHLSWSIPCAIAEVLLLGAIARNDFTRVQRRKADRRFEGALAMVALAAEAVALWSLTHIQGDILDHELFMIAAMGALNLAIILAAALRSLLDVDVLSRRTAVPVVAYSLMFALALAVGVRDLDRLTSFERRRTDRRGIAAAAAAIREYVRVEGVRKPLFRIDQDRWGNAAGVLLRLQQDGIPVAVQDDHGSMFTGALAPTGDEDALVTLANLDLHRVVRAQPGTVVLQNFGPLFVDAARIPPR